MIRRAIIQNFRCLKNVEINLQPLTVLVGANASGKSSLLQALRGHVLPRDRRQRDESHPVSIRLERDNDTPFVGTLGPYDQGWEREGRQPESQLLRLDLRVLRQSEAPVQATRIGEHGENLVSTFATLGRKEQDALATQFKSLVPMYQDLSARTSPGNPQHKRIMFQDRWSEWAWLTPEEVSDGTILLLAFLLIPYQSPPPEILLIEEPERGLHPFLLGELIKLLRALATGGLGPRAVQVVLATHSAELLECVEPKEVRFLSRDQTTGDVLVEEAPHQTADWAKALKEYQGSLGRVWLSGGIGGVPG